MRLSIVARVHRALYEAAKHHEEAPGVRSRSVSGASQP